MHTYLALGCEKIAEPELDPFEDLTVELMDLQEFLNLWIDGGFEHSIISASIALAIKPLRASGHKFSL